MKRSEINAIYKEAKDCFIANGWALPPTPAWDITDFGLADFSNFGLVLINLAEEIEYCEKLMYARKGQTTPLHTHKQKKEDIICRHGSFALELWNGHPEKSTPSEAFEVQINNVPRSVQNGQPVELVAGERITLTPGIYHAFWPITDHCIIGEVSTANDDANDNYFINPDIGRFPTVDEDEAPAIRLLSDPS